MDYFNKFQYERAQAMALDGNRRTKCPKTLFLLLVSCLMSLVVSCQSEQEDASATEGQCTVTFSVSNYRQVSFDDLSGSSATRAVPSNHPATLAHLLVAVFNAETGVLAIPSQKHDYDDYKNEPSAYPQFSITLPYGRYRVLILGFNGSRECKITSVNQISWDADYVPNTFLYCEEFTLDKNTDLNQKITLKHVVAAFRVETEDAIPAELKKMRFSSTAGGTVLDATTGFAPQNTGRISEISVPADSVGKPGMFTAYLFLPQEQMTGNYTVQALGKSDNVIYEKRFNDVPFRINYLTVWQGKFFEESVDVEEQKVGVSLYWDTQWEGTLKFQP